MSQADEDVEYGFSEAFTLEHAAKVIAGNGSPQAKQSIANILHFFSYTGTGFANSVGQRVKVIEVSVNKKAEDPVKLEGRVVCEIETLQDMLNGGHNVHGGCTAYLIDMHVFQNIYAVSQVDDSNSCSSMPFIALKAYNTNESSLSDVSVSQSLNIVYHGPAQLGDILRLVSTTTTMGARIQTASCEVWNVTHHRLVATGVHVKMAPSAPKL